MAVLMTAAYAIYGSEMTLNSTARIMDTWDVRFVDVRLDDGASSLSPFADSNAEIVDRGLTLDIEVVLNLPSDRIVYEADIANFSKIFDVEYVDIDIIYGSSNPFIIWTLDGIDLGDIIPSDTTNGSNPPTRTVTLSAIWNPARINEIPTNAVVESASITLNFQSARDGVLVEGTRPQERPDFIAASFETDFDVVERVSSPTGTRFTYEFAIGYYGSMPAFAWDSFTFEMPSGATLLNVSNAAYQVQGSTVRLSSLPMVPMRFGDEVRVRVTLFSTNPNFDPNEIEMEGVTPVPRPRLTGSLSYDGTQGNRHRYDLTLTNIGDLAADNWRATINLPAGFTFESIAAGFIASPQNNALVISNASNNVIEPGQTITIRFVYSNNPMGNPTIGDINSQTDEIVNPNRPRADLAATLTRGAVSGNTVAYTITVTNDGNATANNWELLIGIAGNNTRIDSITPSNINASIQGNTLRISNPSGVHGIPPNSSITFNLIYFSNQNGVFNLNSVNHW